MQKFYVCLYVDKHWAPLTWEPYPVEYLYVNCSMVEHIECASKLSAYLKNQHNSKYSALYCTSMQCSISIANVCNSRISIVCKWKFLTWPDLNINFHIKFMKFWTKMLKTFHPTLWTFTGLLINQSHLNQRLHTLTPIKWSKSQGTCMHVVKKCSFYGKQCWHHLWKRREYRCFWLNSYHKCSVNLLLRILCTIFLNLSVIKVKRILIQWC